MIRTLSFLPTFALLLSTVAANDIQRTRPGHAPERAFRSHEIPGVAVEGLQPLVTIDVNQEDWGVQIDFIAQTNFQERTWLKPTNRVGSKLQLWLGDNREMRSKNPDVLAATLLPVECSVSNIMRGVPRSRRGMQWLGTPEGKLSPATKFDLRYAFDFPVTNDVVVKLTPLLYRVDDKLEKARLVEFVPFKIKLQANGEVHRIRDE
jgi:hypothetical protein